MLRGPAYIKYTLMMPYPIKNNEKELSQWNSIAWEGAEIPDLPFVVALRNLWLYQDDVTYVQ